MAEPSEDVAPGSPPRVGARQLAIHGGLFVVTCATTYWANGAAFAATLMTILLCHEMGHYLLARRHRIEVSLPYFIPLPPMISFGTLGAVIKMNAPIRDRNQLIDVGADGPIAGLVVAIPSVFGYNFLLGNVKTMITELENYASTLADRIELEAK